MHAQVTVPGPEFVHVALGSQPPLFVRQALIAVHVEPFPEYPGSQVQVTLLGPVLVQLAVVAHPPLLVAQPLTPVHIWPLPV